MTGQCLRLDPYLCANIWRFSTTDRARTILFELLGNVVRLYITYILSVAIKYVLYRNCNISNCDCERKALSRFGERFVVTPHFYDTERALISASIE